MGIGLYIVDPTTRLIAFECLNLTRTFVEVSLNFLEYFYHQMKGGVSDTSRRVVLWI